MTRTIAHSAAVICLALLSAAVSGGETVALKMLDGRSVRCQVMKMSKAGVVVKSEGKEQTMPLKLLTPKEIIECFNAAPEKNGALRLEIANHFLDRKLTKEAEEQVVEALKEDANLADKAAALLKSIDEKKQAAEPAVASVPDKKGKEDKKPDEKEPDSDGDGRDKKMKEMMEQAEDFAARFSHANIPPKAPDEMKKFLDKRLADLNSKIGGQWRLIETRHFYCFSNINEPKHKFIANDWLEKPRAADGTIGIYPLLCDVLKHKESDKLWNNKCPIYFFDTYRQFQEFAGEIDGQPGAGNSGGYFSSRGREVHICIPFMTQRLGDKAADRQAKSTLYHEGTHAFLQLSGEDVRLSRWLHEGLAQFIEFWFDPKNNPERSQRANFLNQMIRQGNVPGWSKMKERPAGGMDIEGYAWAWIKFEFLFRSFYSDRNKLPNMIKLIKAGKKEEDAMNEAFGFTAEKMETVFGDWLKTTSKNGFKFDNQ